MYNAKRERKDIVNQFLLIRLQKRSLYISIAIGLLISIIHIFVRLYGLSTYKDIIFTPYTSWISIDVFSFLSIIFYLTLPLIASLPFSSVLREDLDSGLTNHIFLFSTRKKYFSRVLLVTFYTGFLVIIIPLTINILASFLLLPNFSPDELVNRNINMSSVSTFFISLYYTHPFIHMIFYLVFTSLWGGIFAIFSLGLSIFVKNRLVGVSSSFILQIFLYLINNIFIADKSITPFTFLPAHASMNFVNFSLTCSITFVVLISSLVIYVLGVNKNAIK